jgi:hypothetical protein
LKTLLTKIINNRIFRIVFLCGASGVALDIDHPIHFYLIPELDGRFLHTPALYFFSSIIVCLFLYSAAIYLQQLIRKPSLRTQPDAKTNINLGGFDIFSSKISNTIAPLLNFSLTDIITPHIRQLLERLSRYIGQENRPARFFRKSLPRTTNFLLREFSPTKF